MTQHLSVAEAKALLSNCLRRVERGEPILITRHGKPIAALVPADDLKQLERLRKAGPQKGLASLAGGWDSSEELVQRIERSPRTAPRPAVSVE